MKFDETQQEYKNFFNEKLYVDISSTVILNDDFHVETEWTSKKLSSS